MVFLMYFGLLYSARYVLLQCFENYIFAEGLLNIRQKGVLSVVEFFCDIDYTLATLFFLNNKFFPCLR